MRRVKPGPLDMDGDQFPEDGLRVFHERIFIAAAPSMVQLFDGMEGGQSGFLFY